MDEPGPPPTLLRHTCKQGPVPPAEGEVGERERLRAALVWSYEYDLLIHDAWTIFSSSVLFRTPESSGPVPQARFEVTEDPLGIERTVLLRRTSGVVSMEEVELIPLDPGGTRELPFKLLESSPGQRCIRYPGGPEYRPWRVRVGGLGVLRNPTALAEAWAGGWEPVRFDQPVWARVESSDEFRVDRLSPADGARRAPQEQLVDLFSLLCEGMGPDSVTFRVGCVYAHRLDGTDMGVTTPVFQSAAELHDFSELAVRMTDAMRSWHSSVRPPAGEFIMRLQIYGLDPEGVSPHPLVDFSRLLMPSETVVEFA